MKIESGAPQEPQADRRPSLFAQRVFSVLLFCVACFSIRIPCLGQGNQRLEDPLVRTASQENSPKTAGQDAQSTAPAHSSGAEYVVIDVTAYETCLETLHGFEGWKVLVNALTGQVEQC
jgi:hypothetical protein